VISIADRGQIRTARFAGALVLSAGLCLGVAAAAQDRFVEARAEMVHVIERHAGHAEAALGRRHIAAAVLEAMAEVPRHAFVPEYLADLAYADRPLPIGHGQTISQPFIVALMTDLAGIRPGDRVLEVGTGSGYQAAVAVALEVEVYSIEIIQPLAEAVRKRFDRLGLQRIQTRHGDGYYGWEGAAPFDAILVTAAASHVPPPLVRQLKPGGRMVIPVGGGGFSFQYLMLVEKAADGEVRTRQLLPVRFVPLTGGH
jgi:protein-L-isoaspartate(D-aspartate) O-methyltransferase